jgi:hypothetical protein
MYTSFLLFTSLQCSLATGKRGNVSERMYADVDAQAFDGGVAL